MPSLSSPESYTGQGPLNPGGAAGFTATGKGDAFIGVAGCSATGRSKRAARFVDSTFAGLGNFTVVPEYATGIEGCASAGRDPNDEFNGCADEKLAAAARATRP